MGGEGYSKLLAKNDTDEGMLAKSDFTKPKRYCKFSNHFSRHCAKKRPWVVKLLRDNLYSPLITTEWPQKVSAILASESSVLLQKF